MASIIVLAGLKFLERFALVRMRGGVTAYKILVHGALRMGDIGSVVEDLGGRLQSLKVFEDEAEGWSLAALIQLPSGVPSDLLVDRLRALPGVIDVDTEIEFSLASSPRGREGCQRVQGRVQSERRAEIAGLDP